MSLRKRRSRFAKAFGLSEVGLPDIPPRYSGIKIARIAHTDERGGCSHCFPHGPETTNATAAKNRRSWKLHRSKQHR